MPITLKQISVFPDDTRLQEKAPILDGLNCTFYDGEVTLIIGRVGAGKSTLLDTIGALRKPSAGMIHLNQEPVWQGGRTHHKTVSRIGMVFQAPDEQLFAKSVLREFKYSLRHLKLREPELKERAAEALNNVGLPSHLIDASPHHLSQGQKRRVALATTFASRPDWLLLDEPTAGLDVMASRQFIRYLQEHQKRCSGGIIIATHDLDLLLPLAQRVLVLDRGRIVVDVAPQQLLQNPGIWNLVQIGVPSAVQLSGDLKASGCPVEIASFHPGAAAAAIARRLAATEDFEDCTARDAQQYPDLQVTQEEDQNPDSLEDNRGSTWVPIGWLPTAEFIKQLDPRAKWLAYMLLSVALLFQTNWTGLMASTVITIGVILVSRVKVWETLRLLTPFFVLVVVSAVFAGVNFSGQAPLWRIKMTGFSWSAANVTLQSLFPFLLMMMIGVLLPATTSQLRMKQGLEQGLQSLKKWRIPVEAFSLAASLTLRFIPVITGELQRFSRIAKARGHGKRHSRGIPVRDVPAVIIPLLLSILAIADQLSTAMEARGYHSVGQTRTRSVHLQFTRADWKLIHLALIASFVLLLFRL